MALPGPARPAPPALSERRFLPSAQAPAAAPRRPADGAGGAVVDRTAGCRHPPSASLQGSPASAGGGGSPGRGAGGGGGRSGPAPRGKLGAGGPGAFVRVGNDRSRPGGWKQGGKGV